MSSTEFANEILASHNKYRNDHQAPNLKISDKLNKFAQEWAENLAKNEKFEHRPKNPYGENLYMASNTDPNWKLKGETVVKSWYDEIKLYKFGEPSPKNSSEVGHFTQLVWKDTKDLGIGEAKSKAGKVYVVCNYDPPGNVLQEFAKNVLPSIHQSQNENGNGQTTEQTEDADETEREKIVLTPSQEKLGIQIVQPNTKIVESMERLYAVSSEKIRVWSVWLTKVEEEACEWHSWIRSHINLVLRMAEYLRRAEETIEMEQKIRNENKMMKGEESEEQYRDGDELGLEKTLVADDTGYRLDDLSRGTYAVDNQEPRESQTGRRGTSEKQRSSSSAKGEEAEEDWRKDGRVRSSEIGVEPSAAERTEEPSTVLENSTKEKNDEEDMTDRKREKNRESYEENENEDGIEGLAKIAWPIGVPWEPVEMSTTKKKEVEKKKNDKVEVIPIPVNEEDMQRLIREVRHQATIYRSRYKHWLEVADRAIKEIMNRTVMPSEKVLTDEEIPYFFYLNAEPDIEIGVENDDEKILLPDLTRERITREFTPLYFNLADKPGKGGKPWL